MTRWALHLLLLVAAGAAGCESRYADLLEPARTVDTVVAERSRTWIGSRGGTTYVLVASGDDLEREGAAAIVRVDRGGDLFILVGLYTYDGERTLTLDVATRFTALWDAGTPYLAREGARREPLFPAERQSWRFEREASGAFLGPPEGAQVDMLPLEDVVVGVAERGAAYPALVARLLALPLRMAQARIPGFGGFRMADYAAASPVRFPALLGGEVVLYVSDLGGPMQRLDLVGAKLLTDVVASGRWQQDSNLTGRGALSGRIDVRFEGAGDPTTWSLDLGAVTLEQGLPAGGEVSWTSPSVAEPQAVGVEDWTDLDFSRLYEVVR